MASKLVQRQLFRGTHEYEKLIRPSELAAWTRQAGLDVQFDAHYAAYSKIFERMGMAAVPVEVEQRLLVPIAHVEVAARGDELVAVPPAFSARATTA